MPLLSISGGEGVGLDAPGLGGRPADFLGHRRGGFECIGALSARVICNCGGTGGGIYYVHASPSALGKYEKQKRRRRLSTIKDGY